MRALPPATQGKARQQVRQARTASQVRKARKRAKGNYQQQPYGYFQQKQTLTWQPRHRAFWHRLARTKAGKPLVLAGIRADGAVRTLDRQQACNKRQPSNNTTASDTFPAAGHAASGLFAAATHCSTCNAYTVSPLRGQRRPFWRHMHARYTAACPPKPCFPFNPDCSLGFNQHGKNCHASTNGADCKRKCFGCVWAMGTLGSLSAHVRWYLVSSRLVSCTSHTYLLNLLMCLFFWQRYQKPPRTPAAPRRNLFQFSRLFRPDMLQWYRKQAIRAAMSVGPAKNEC